MDGPSLIALSNRIRGIPSDRRGMVMSLAVMICSCTVCCNVILCGDGPSAPQWSMEMSYSDVHIPKMSVCDDICILISSLYSGLSLESSHPGDMPAVKVAPAENRQTCSPSNIQDNNPEC